MPSSPVAGSKKVQAARNAVPEDTALGISPGGSASHSRLLGLHAARLKLAQVQGPLPRQQHSLPDSCVAPDESRASGNTSSCHSGPQPCPTTHACGISAQRNSLATFVFNIFCSHFHVHPERLTISGHSPEHMSLITAPAAPIFFT